MSLAASEDRRAVGHAWQVLSRPSVTDAEKRRRRAEVLRFPMVPLELTGHLVPSRTDAAWERLPKSVGIGPRGERVALWTEHSGPRTLATWHTSATEPERSIELPAAAAGQFVQPAGDGGVLIVAARQPARGSRTATAWRYDDHGQLLCQADVGDALAHVLVTDAGAAWVGYFDEALGGDGPEGHGLARFTSSLDTDWVYPWHTALPPMHDIYAMNVSGETAWTCAYSDFHVVSITGGNVTDWGPAPARGPHALLVDGSRGALVGGYGAEYDVVTPVAITPDGVARAGHPGRVVMPDGLEVPRTRWQCRGPNAHLQHWSSTYRLELDLIFNALV